MAKVSDFGLSKTFYDNVRYKKRFRHYVPWKWMAIEYLKDACFTMKSDVWSYGVVLWEIFSLGQEPYAGKSIEEVITQIKTGYRMPCPDEVVDVAWADDVYRDVMKKCWDAGESCEPMGLFLCTEWDMNVTSFSSISYYSNLRLISNMLYIYAIVSSLVK